MSLFGGKMAVEAASSVATGIVGALDGLFTSDEEKAEATRKLTETLQAPVLGQLEVNKAEAMSEGVFKGGWRPAIGWVGAISLLYQFVVRDLLAWGLALYDQGILPPPVIDNEALWAIITGMLGLAGTRTYDLAKGTRK